MDIPSDKEIFDNGMALVWLDETGIVYSKSKKNVPMTRESLKKAFDVIKQLSKGEKICLLADMTLTSAPEKKEAYEYAMEEMKNIVKAHAMIAGTPLSKMIAHLYLFLKKPPYPAKIFTDEWEAKQWLKQHL